MDRAHLRRILVFSLPLVAFAASQYGMRSVDIIVLRANHPASDVGIYALAYRCYTMLQTLAVTLTIVLIPLFVSLREAGRLQLVALYFERLVPQAILAVAALGGLLAPLTLLVVPIVLGAEFEGVARPLALLMAVLVLFTVASLLAPIVMLYERTREASIINVVALAVNVAGDIIRVGPIDLGILGPAIATIGALAVSCVAILQSSAATWASGLRCRPCSRYRWLPACCPPSCCQASGSRSASSAQPRPPRSFCGVWRCSKRRMPTWSRLDLPYPLRERAVAAIGRLAR